MCSFNNDPHNIINLRGEISRADGVYGNELVSLKQVASNIILEGTTGRNWRF